jgi:hypothetical protein
LYPLQAPIEERFMGDTKSIGQTTLVGRKAVILAGNQHRTIVNVLYRMISTVVTELHFRGFCARGQRKQLMAKADTKDRNFCLQELLDGLDSIRAGLRVTGAIG